MIPLTTQQLAQQLNDLRPEERIVFAHPNFKAQHLFLTTLLANAVYIRFQGQGLDDAAVQAQFAAALEQQQVGKIGARRAAKPEYLVLDEADRILPESLRGLLHRLLNDYPAERILVLSRVLLQNLLSDAEICRQAKFLPSETALMLWNYAQSGSDVLLEVRAFGNGRVHLNGRSVEAWDGALPRALFFYLVDRGMVTRAEIFKTFWPDLSTREATNVFHVTKRKISEVLGTELTVYGSSFYHISPRIQLSYDVSLFNQLVQDSESVASSGSVENGDALGQALALYRGNYLTSLKSDWVLNRRESLQQSACDALIALGKIHENLGESRAALGHYLQASRLKPEREDCAYAIMRLYRDLEMRQDALQVYRCLVRTLNDGLKVAPSAQLQQLAAQLES